MSSRPADPTPVFVGASVARHTLNPDAAGQGDKRVIMHDRGDPCGHVDDDAVPTFRAFVEESAADLAISTRPCQWCGGSI